MTMVRVLGTFPKGFRPAVKLRKPDYSCSLKRHFRGVLREVIGVLDLWAANNSQRFVFASVSGVQKECNNFRKGKKHYSLRAVKYALRYFRMHGVLRPAVCEMDGKDRLGYIVASHDDMTLPIRGACVVMSCRANSFDTWVALPGQKFPVFEAGNGA
jgi:hypothetical protein